MAQDRPTAKVGACSNSTVEEWGPERAAQARAFLAALKLAVRRRDKKAVASTVLYPLRLFVGARETTVRDSAEFVKKYEQILQPRIVAAIVDQDPDCLFGNWQGAMVGHGEVWFQRQSSGEFKIITVNLGSSPNGKEVASYPRINSCTYASSAGVQP
jgi:hypothetical protein